MRPASLLTRRVRILGSAATCLLAGLTQADAQTTTVLRGELLLRDGQPAQGVQLVIVGHPPEVLVQDGGLFSHPLSGTPTEITVRVDGQTDVEILFPPGGRVVVPRDPSAVVSILVGRRIGAMVGDQIQRDLQSIRETLEVRGVSAAEIEKVLSAEQDSLVTRIAALTEGAIDVAMRRAQQAELREGVNRHLGTYVRRTRDFVGAFALVDVSREITLSESLILRDAIGNYSDAFAELDRELMEVPTALERAWPGESGIALRDRMNRILTVIRSDLHPQMLDLNGPLVIIQREFTPDRPRKDELRSARQTVIDGLARLAPALAGLEVEVPNLMEALRAPSR